MCERKMRESFPDLFIKWLWERSSRFTAKKMIYCL